MEISCVRPDVSDVELTLRLLDPGDGAPGSCENVLIRPGSALPPAAAGSRPGEVFLSASGASGDGGTCRSAGALWVMAPTDVASTPVSATALTVSSAMDQDRCAFGAHRDHAALIAA
jgi:hypothetical protein